MSTDQSPGSGETARTSTSGGRERVTGPRREADAAPVPASTPAQARASQPAALGPPGGDEPWRLRADGERTRANIIGRPADSPDGAMNGTARPGGGPESRGRARDRAWEAGGRAKATVAAWARRAVATPEATTRLQGAAATALFVLLLGRIRRNRRRRADRTAA